MNIRNRYLVGGVTDVRDGTRHGSRKITIHDTHDSAVNECHRRLGEPGNYQQYVIYRAVSVVKATHPPVDVCDIAANGEVSCR